MSALGYQVGMVLISHLRYHFHFCYISLASRMLIFLYLRSAVEEETSQERLDHKINTAPVLRIQYSGIRKDIQRDMAKRDTCTCTRSILPDNR